LGVIFTQAISYSHVVLMILTWPTSTFCLISHSFSCFFWSLVFCFWILRTLENRRNQQKPTWSHKWYKGRLPYCFCRLDTFPVKNSVDAIALDQFTFDRAVGLRWIVWGVEILHGNPDSHMRGYHLSKRNSVLSYRKTTHSLPSLLVSLFLWWIALRRS